jgi:hypothetical protein
MRNVRRVLIAIAVILSVAVTPSLLTGCASHGEHPEGEHPTEHPEE